MTDTANAQTDVALDGRPFGTGYSRFLGVVLTEAGPHRTRAWAQPDRSTIRKPASFTAGGMRRSWTRPDDGKLVARGQLRLQHITVRD